MAPASRARFSRPIFAPNSRALSRPGRKGRLRPAAAFRALPRPGDSAPGPSGPGPRSQTRIRRGPGRYRSPPRAALGDPGRRGGDRRAGARRPQRRRRVGGGTRCRVTAEPTEGRLHSESESLPGRASRPRSHASWWLECESDSESESDSDESDRRFPGRRRSAAPPPSPSRGRAPHGWPRARDLPCTGRSSRLASPVRGVRRAGPSQFLRVADPEKARPRGAVPPNDSDVKASPAAVVARSRAPASSSAAVAPPHACPSPPPRQHAR